jgi:hypothetical protein
MGFFYLSNLWQKIRKQKNCHKSCGKNRRVEKIATKNVAKKH